MATAKKKSLRKEFDKLKSDFIEQASSKPIPSEKVELINDLITMQEMLMAIFLEKNTKKTDKNSSKPSSQTKKDNSFTDKPGTHGKGTPKTSVATKNVRTVESVTVLPVTTCERCGRSLADVPCRCLVRRSRIDIVFEKTVEHMDAEVKHCPSCGHANRAAFPDGCRVSYNTVLVSKHTPLI
jgi:transposase